MKLISQHKQRLLGLVLCLSLVMGVCALPATTSASSPASNFAINGCPGKQVRLKVQKTLQKDSYTCCPPGTNSTATTCLFGKYVNPLVNLLAALVGLAVAGGIIYGGIMYSTSAGDPQKAANGKDHIRNALIALLAYILLYSFIQFLIPGGKFNV